MGTIARKQIFPLLKVYFGPVMSRRPPREPKMKVILYGAQAILDSLLKVSRSLLDLFIYYDLYYHKPLCGFQGQQQITAE